MTAAKSGPACIGPEMVEEIETLHVELVARGAEITQAIERKPWGNRNFRVHDPFGNELKFTEFQ
jgi:uncharacterized glyoxalase superfamily protein PhnB